MRKKEQIKIDFAGFWSDLDKQNNFFIDTLRKEYEPVISEKPDYLFYSLFSDEYLNYSNDVIRIFFTGESQVPDFNLADYALGFDWIEFGDRYQRFPLYNLYSDILEKAENRGGMTDNPVRRDKFCSFVCSNSKADPIRSDFFKRLAEERKVDSGGRLYNNVGGPVKDKVKFEEGHRFSLCFENSSYPGYTTEKILQAFAAGTIPVYWGDPDIGKVFNKRSFIFVNEFKSIEDAVKRVLEIDDDPEQFFAMLKEKPFLPNGLPEKQIKEAQEFILGIIRRPKKSAYRRNMTFWGKNYELFFRRYCNINMRLRKIKNIIRK